jgi:hypothetical protein
LHGGNPIAPDFGVDIDRQRAEVVEVRGEPWIISCRTVCDGCALLRLEGRGAHNLGARSR